MRNYYYLVYHNTGGMALIGKYDDYDEAFDMLTDYRELGYDVSMARYYDDENGFPHLA